MKGLIRFLRTWASLGVLSLCLVACATPGRIADGPAGDVFERTGRFALNVVHAGGKPEAVQGGFAWSDNGRELRLDLANPLGNTLARVQVTPARSVMTRSNGSTEQASSPDALVAEVLGSPIPVAGLRHWLQGRTGEAPVQDLQKNDAGQPTAFRQNGWQVALSRYDPQGPRLLQMTRTEAGDRISVRLVIDSD